MVSLRMEKYESAEADCSRAIALDPNYIKGWARRGSAKLKQGKYAEVYIALLYKYIFLFTIIYN